MSTYRYKQMWHQALKAHRARFKLGSKPQRVSPVDNGNGGFNVLVSGEDGWAKWDISGWRVKCVACRINGVPPLGDA